MQGCCAKCPADRMAPSEGSVNSISGDSCCWQGRAVSMFLALLVELALRRFGEGGLRLEVAPRRPRWSEVLWGRSQGSVSAAPESVKSVLAARGEVWGEGGGAGAGVCFGGGAYQTPAGDSCAGCRLSTPCPRPSHTSLGQSRNRAWQVWPCLSTPVRKGYVRILGVGVERGASIIPR